MAKKRPRETTRKIIGETERFEIEQGHYTSTGEMFLRIMDKPEACNFPDRLRFQFGYVKAQAMIECRSFIEDFVQEVAIQKQKARAARILQAVTEAIDEDYDD